MPWMPYFEKIAEADIFCIMTWCQFEKNNYQNRFYDNGWHTMSVSSGLELIRRKKYVNAEKDFERIIKKYPNLSRFEVNESLYITNSRIIIEICQILGITTPIVFDKRTAKKGTARLVEICQMYGATDYLSGESGTKYLDMAQFDKAGINVTYHRNREKSPIVNHI